MEKNLPIYKSTFFLVWSIVGVIVLLHGLLMLVTRIQYRDNIGGGYMMKQFQNKDQNIPGQGIGAPWQQQQRQ